MEMVEKDIIFIVKLYNSHLSVKVNNGGNVIKKIFSRGKGKKVNDVGSLADFGNELCSQYRNAYDFLKQMVEIGVLEVYIETTNVKYYKLNKKKIYDILTNLSNDSLFDMVWNVIGDYNMIVGK